MPFNGKTIRSLLLKCSKEKPWCKETQKEINLFLSWIANDFTGCALESLQIVIIPIVGENPEEPELFILDTREQTLLWAEEDASNSDINPTLIDNPQGLREAIKGLKTSPFAADSIEKMVRLIDTIEDLI